VSKICNHQYQLSRKLKKKHRKTSKFQNHVAPFVPQVKGTDMKDPKAYFDTKKNVFTKCSNIFLNIEIWKFSAKISILLMGFGFFVM